MRSLKRSGVVVSWRNALGRTGRRGIDGTVLLFTMYGVTGPGMLREMGTGPTHMREIGQQLLGDRRLDPWTGSQLPDVARTRQVANDGLDPQAKKILAEDDSIDHEYLPIAGLTTFTGASAKLIFGEASPAIKAGLVSTYVSPRAESRE